MSGDSRLLFPGTSSGVRPVPRPLKKHSRRVRGSLTCTLPTHPSERTLAAVARAMANANAGAARPRIRQRAEVDHCNSLVSELEEHRHQISVCSSSWVGQTCVAQLDDCSSWLSLSVLSSSLPYTTGCTGVPRPIWTAPNTIWGLVLILDSPIVCFINT